jgi:ketosteroid isomerase-like protein
MQDPLDDVTRAGSQARASFVDALRQGDAAVVSSLYTENARLLAPAAPPIRGRRAIERYWQTGLEAGIHDVEFQLVAIEAHGRIAYELGRYALAVDSDGGGVVDRGDYLFVHEQQDDGSWRWSVEMLNPDVPTFRATERERALSRARGEVRPRG